MSDPIDAVAREAVAAMTRRIEDQFVEAMLGGSTFTSNISEPSEPLTAASILKTMKSLGPPPLPRAGHIIESAYMVDRHEDWSRARSPSRTRRRMRYNAGRIYTYTPKKEALRMPDGSLVMHPAMAQQLRQLPIR